MQIEVNLLPWRQIMRNTQQRKFLASTLIVSASIMIMCLLMHYHFARLNNEQTKRNQEIKKNIDIFAEKILEINQMKKKKKEMTKMVEFVEKLRNEGYFFIRLFDELTKIIPNGIYLNNIQLKNRKIALNGESEFNHLIPILMKNIEKNPWMKNPNLLEIKKVDNSHRSLFHIIVIPNFKKN
ncbi:PilN domain-containing protein [Legionella micdadei]|uniref:Putative Tfp pilus assembly protein PilN n=1 Tax=Legionella micdadei TaxID=451 RepID=A0A098GER1_LEGMI|nr:PilN domain-containing protein [Legionella micdadei]ARG97893.1 hypothetical protein B6N58_09610 [Legionella micdadei]ARG99787.1 hypothetical protein B6V88_04800 [Legionella micdadei]KTD28615.1 Tfp pilus assembly protein PilN [Legionella micdadei]NSL19206.1 PilN domain-containing protein [Legionella micdadei]CEG60492.1 putative Tfp pilus assembly protein PilN [Legionella micdadei]